MTGDTIPDSSRTIFLLRAAIGLLQGLALFALVHAADTTSWPATQPMLYAPLLVGCFFVPLVAIVGLGNLRGRTLALWIVAAVVLCAGLAVYDIYRDPGTPPRHDPRAVLWLALVAGLFIAHSLIVAGNTDRKYLAAHATDFRASSRKACPRT